MDAKTLKALKGSIKKWEGIVAGTTTDLGANNCPLCRLFILFNCRGCPVRERTLRVGCYDTPYIEHVRSPTVANARKEVAFLRSLLPKPTRRKPARKKKRTAKKRRSP